MAAVWKGLYSPLASVLTHWLFQSSAAPCILSIDPESVVGARWTKFSLIVQTFAAARTLWRCMFLFPVIDSFQRATGCHKHKPTALLSSFTPTEFIPAAQSLLPLFLPLLCFLAQCFSEADASFLWALYGNWMPPLADVFVTHEMFFWSLISIQAARRAWDHQRWNCFKL